MQPNARFNWNTGTEGLTDGGFLMRPKKLPIITLPPFAERSRRPLFRSAVLNKYLKQLNSEAKVGGEEADRLTYFTSEKAKAQALNADIAKTYAAIDALAHKLNGLTEVEMGVVEGK